jgi:hypothetical protein
MDEWSTIGSIYFGSDAVVGDLEDSSCILEYATSDYP